MISQEQFEELEQEHGCGYWNVCWEHACPCAITVENKGLQESIYNSLRQEAEEVAKECDNDDFEYEPMARCEECGCRERESDLTDGLCFDCYEEDTFEDEEMDCLVCTLDKDSACADCCRDWDNEEEEE